MLTAVHDIKDTSEATGSKLWNEAREHFNYRIGDKDSFWGQVIQKKLIQKGLIAAAPKAAPAGPSALSAPSAPSQPVSR